MKTMPPTKKKKRTFHSNLPIRSGLASNFLQETYVYKEGISMDELLNGHVLYLYISSSYDVRKTCNNLAVVFQTPYDHLTYSVNRLLNSSLKKFHKLSSTAEMETFKQICTSRFEVLMRTPRASGPVPAEQGPVGGSASVPNSPIKTKRSASCGNCLNLRRKLALTLKEKELAMKRKKIHGNCKLQPKKLKEKLKRKEKRIDKLNQKFEGFKNKLSASYVGELEAEVQNLKRKNKVKDNKIASLKEELKTIKTKHGNELKDLEVEYQVQTLFLEEDLVQDKNQDSKLSLELKKAGRIHNIRMRTAVYQCLMANVPTDQVTLLIHSMLATFGVTLDVKDIPARSSIQNMMIELGVISDLQSAEVLLKAGTCTLGFDATMREGSHVSSIHFTTKSECHIMGLEELAGGTAVDFHQHIIKTLDHLAWVLVEFHSELQLMDVRDKMIENIKCSMTDRASVNHATVRLVNESFGKTLIEVNCHLHPLDSIASKCRSALLAVEQSKNIHGNLFGTGCLAERCILGLNKLRYVDGKGDPHGFRVFLRKKKLPESLIVRYRGNRLHIMFKLGAVYVVHHDKIQDYLQHHCLLIDSSGLKSGMIEDFANPVTQTELKVIAIVGKLLTGPWLKKFYRDAAEQLQHMDAFFAVKHCLESVQALLAQDTLLLHDIHTDFFGSHIDKSESSIWSDEHPSPLFDTMIRAVLTSASEVIKKQYQHYYELEKEMSESMEDSLETARTHNMDSEEVIGMFSAIQSKAPNATLLFISSKIKSKKNKTLQYLHSLPVAEGDQVVRKAITVATKVRRCARKSTQDLQKELSDRIMKKMQKKATLKRNKIEKEIKSMMASGEMSLASLTLAFPSLDNPSVAVLHDIILGKLVGKRLLHNWGEEDSLAEETWNGKVEAFKEATKSKASGYLICYWRDSESYDENGTDWWMDINKLAADFIVGDCEVTM